jgi:hypothetical protein
MDGAPSNNGSYMQLCMRKTRYPHASSTTRSNFSKKTKERPECVDRYLGRLVSCIKQNLLYMERQDSATGSISSINLEVIGHFLFLLGVCSINSHKDGSGSVLERISADVEFASCSFWPIFSPRDLRVWIYETMWVWGGFQISPVEGSIGALKRC